MIKDKTKITFIKDITDIRNIMDITDITVNQDTSLISDITSSTDFI
jgi:hypothetical protein